MAELLLLFKADVNSVDDQTQTPLPWGAYNGHESVAQLLRSRTPNARSLSFFSPSIFQTISLSPAFPSA